jgi:hypothetical protein
MNIICSKFFWRVSQSMKDGRNNTIYLRIGMEELGWGIKNNTYIKEYLIEVLKSVLFVLRNQVRVSQEDIAEK